MSILFGFSYGYGYKIILVSTILKDSLITFTFTNLHLENERCCKEKLIFKYLFMNNIIFIIDDY